MIADQIDEGDVPEGPCRHPALALGDAQQLLLPARLPHGDHHDPGIGQLFQKRQRQVRPPRRDDDPVERGLLLPAERAVPEPHADSRNAERGEQVPCGEMEFPHALHRADLKPHLAEHRGLIARSRADFEHGHSGLRFQQLRHVGDDVRLGNGLAEADGQGVFLIGAVLQRFRNETVPPDGTHGGKYGLVRNALRLKPPHHPGALTPEIGKSRVLS